MREQTEKNFHPRLRGCVTDGVREALQQVQDFQWPAWSDRPWTPPECDPEKGEIVGYHGGRFDGKRVWPIEVECLLTPPEFMSFAFTCIYGGMELFTFGCADLETAMRLVIGGHRGVNDGEPLPRHPRYRRTVLVRAVDVDLPDGFKVGGTIHQNTAWTEADGEVVDG